MPLRFHSLLALLALLAALALAGCGRQTTPVSSETADPATSGLPSAQQVPSQNSTTTALPTR